MHQLLICNSSRFILYFTVKKPVAWKICFFQCDDSVSEQTVFALETRTGVIRLAMVNLASGADFPEHLQPW